MLYFCGKYLVKYGYISYLKPDHRSGQLPWKWWYVTNNCASVLSGTETGLWADHWIRACIISHSEVKLSADVWMAWQKIPRCSTRIGWNPAYITYGMYLVLSLVLYQ